MVKLAKMVLVILVIMHDDAYDYNSGGNGVVYVGNHGDYIDHDNMSD